MDTRLSILDKLAGQEGLRLVSRIFIGLSLIALLIFFVILNYFANDKSDYSTIVQTLWNTRDNLNMVILAVASVLLAAIGVMTWLFCLYASFRLAGPLYRLENLLELETADKHKPFIPLRKNDSTLLKMSYDSFTDAIESNSQQKKGVLAIIMCRLRGKYLL